MRQGVADGAAYVAGLGGWQQRQVATLREAVALNDALGDPTALLLRR